MTSCTSHTYDKERLIVTVQTLLDTDENLQFLLKLEKEELEKLTALIRAGIESPHMEER